MFRRLAACIVLLAFATPSWADVCPLFSQVMSANVLNQPAQVVQLANGHFLVADTYNDRLVEMAEDWTQLGIHGPLISGHGTLSRPAGVAVDLVGRVYVADQQNHRILKFDSSMAPMAEWGTFGSGPGNLNAPTNLTLSPDGTVLYVAELLGHRVTRFTTDGVFLGSWGAQGSGPGQFDHPFGIATDGAGKVFVSDQQNNRVEIFSSTGTYLSQFGSPGSGPGQFNTPTGITFDDSGNLYVADANNNRIQRYNHTSVWRCSFTDGFNAPMSHPWWAYQARDANIYVADDYYAQVVRFANPVPGAGGMNLSWTDCGAFGTQNRIFACASNTGSNTMVASFSTNASIPDFAGIELRVDLQSADATTLNNWWQMFNAGSCRGTSVPTINTSFGPNCADVFAGSGSGGIGSYSVVSNSARLYCYWALPQSVPIAPDVEYYALNIVVNNTRTVGPGACAGCATGVCVFLKAIGLVHGPNATLTQTIANPLTREFITWEGGAVTGGCPGAVPTQKQTWGQLKALYR